jgi:hypothetical protein
VKRELGLARVPQRDILLWVRLQLVLERARALAFGERTGTSLNGFRRDDGIEIQFRLSNRRVRFDFFGVHHSKTVSRTSSKPRLRSSRSLDSNPRGGFRETRGTCAATIPFRA